MKINTDKFIGIPHVFNGDTYEACDCIGLARLFYAEHNWTQDFKDGQEITKDWQSKDRGRLFRYLKRNFVETRDAHSLTYGDIAVYNIDGDYHIGIYLEYGKVLAMQVPCKEHYTTSTIYREQYWKPYFVRGYRRESHRNTTD